MVCTALVRCSGLLVLTEKMGTARPLAAVRSQLPAFTLPRSAKTASHACSTPALYFKYNNAALHYCNSEHCTTAGTTLHDCSKPALCGCNNAALHDCNSEHCTTLHDCSKPALCECNNAAVHDCNISVAQLQRPRCITVAAQHRMTAPMPALCNSRGNMTLTGKRLSVAVKQCKLLADLTFFVF